MLHCSFDSAGKKAAIHRVSAWCRSKQMVRHHWSIENQLHWSLDVQFREDDRRICKGHGAEIYSRLCRIALNLLKTDTSVKLGIKGKRLTAGWDHDYLLKLITQET